MFENDFLETHSERVKEIIVGAFSPVEQREGAVEAYSAGHVAKSVHEVNGELQSTKLMRIMLRFSSDSFDSADHASNTPRANFYQFQVSDYSPAMSLFLIFESEVPWTVRSDFPGLGDTVVSDAAIRDAFERNSAAEPLKHEGSIGAEDSPEVSRNLGKVATEVTASDLEERESDSAADLGVIDASLSQWEPQERGDISSDLAAEQRPSDTDAVPSKGDGESERAAVAERAAEVHSAPQDDAIAELVAGTAEAVIPMGMRPLMQQLAEETNGIDWSNVASSGSVALLQSFVRLGSASEPGAYPVSASAEWPQIASPGEGDQEAKAAHWQYTVGALIATVGYWQITHSVAGGKRRHPSSPAAAR